MNLSLSQKYWLVLGSLSIVGFLLIGLLGLAFAFIRPPYANFLNPVFYLLLGTVGALCSLSAIRLLFSAEEIVGGRGKYKVTPDLHTFELVEPYENSKPEIPGKAYCSECGNLIHSPFRCNSCGKLLCGKHILRGEHVCIETPPYRKWD